MKVVFKPGDGLRVKVVGRLVKQKDVGLLQKQAAKGHAAPFASAQDVDNLVGRRATQGFHRKLQVCVQVPRVSRVKFFLQLRLPRSQLVVVRVGIAKGFVDFVKFLKQIGDGLYAFLYDVDDGLSCFEFRLLLKVANRVTWSQRRLARKVLVHARQNLKERRLSRTIGTNHANLRAIVIRNAHVLKNDLRSISSRNPVHRVNYFFVVDCFCHFFLLLPLGAFFTVLF